MCVVCVSGVSVWRVHVFPCVSCVCGVRVRVVCTVYLCVVGVYTCVCGVCRWCVWCVEYVYGVSKYVWCVCGVWIRLCDRVRKCGST